MDVLVTLRVLLIKHTNFSTIGVDFRWISTLFLTTVVAMNSALKVSWLCCLHVVVPFVQRSRILLLYSYSLMKWVWCVLETHSWLELKSAGTGNFAGWPCLSIMISFVHTAGMYFTINKNMEHC